PGPKEEKGCPEPIVTSRARVTRRRLVGSMRVAPSGSRWARRAWSASSVAGVELGLEGGGDAGKAGRDAEVVHHGTEVEAGAADQQGMVAPLGDGDQSPAGGG